MSINKKSLILTFLASLMFVLTSTYFHIASNNDLTIAQTAAPECKVVKHQLGQTCVPIHTPRVITLDEFMLDTVLSLGIKPIAAGENNLASNRGIQFNGKTEGIISIGKWTQPKLEKILQFKPDLILGYGMSSENYKLLSQIAPTVSLEYNLYDWKTPLRQVGEILNKKAEASQAILLYQQRVEKLRQTLGKRVTQIKISVARFYQAGGIDIYPHKISFPGGILDDIGFVMPTEQVKHYSNSEIEFLSINLERLDLLDADVMFVILDPGSEKKFKNYQTSKLWQLLNIVKNRKIYTVDSGYWAFGNFLAADAILDDLYKYLLALS